MMMAYDKSSVLTANILIPLLISCSPCLSHSVPRTDTMRDCYSMLFLHSTRHRKKPFLNPLVDGLTYLQTPKTLSFLHQKRLMNTVATNADESSIRIEKLG